MAAKNPKLACDGFKCFAGPFAASEEHMMSAFINDAYRANKEVRLSQTSAGMWIWQRSRKAD
jgi:hypothetical protein